ncbi:MAG: hypothetical protein E5V49_15540 [Mesorhizobium sp.]|nr:hypothetical protein EN848_01490 [bacterium M00.F.Ca.ET.205.01.1.1]TGU54532.1 hypothetical protein EN795_05905 [bacterium M00.F.Ca.ET.152.01.1.1]TGV38683.1 hypothetical protein EN829_007175 [Mesorhizobium sp. M00.F.Ca.ET.186.01.1.1]TGZ44104.1 hypothetical protein EN805_05910 [bacterium M00.F.Ca.ET.162.01.1.1]TIW60605.1 MAG: hypothetical protein E5V48_12845 [Mesorhizobium sp.]
MALFRMAVFAALVCAGSAQAADMAFFIKNLRPQSVAVELFSHDRETVWPGNDKVFLIGPGEKKSVPISCNSGERICYGAWVDGNDQISAGVGPDNDQPCDTCCFICVEHTTETIDLVE